MILSNVINKMFRKLKKSYIIYDTSAISNNFEKFKRVIKSKKSMVIVPEGCLHEIHEAKSYNVLCRAIYNYITTESMKKNSNLIVDKIEDKYRSWSVDEQVIYTARKYKKRGNAKLVSCDKEQCFRAGLQNVNYNLEAVIKENNKKNTIKKRTKNFKIIIEEPKKFALPQISVEYIILNKEKYLKFDNNLSVYDSKGKRRIGRDGYIKFENTDKFYYFEKEYIIEKIENKKVVFITKE